MNAGTKITEVAKERKVMIVSADPLQKREAYVARIRELLKGIEVTEAQLNRKIDQQLQTIGGIDSLSFDGLEKVIKWLEGKQSRKSSEENCG